MVVLLPWQSWPVSDDATEARKVQVTKSVVVSQRYNPAGPDVTHKICARCGEDKPRADYWPRPDGGLTPYCKPCERIIKREWYARNSPAVQKRKERQREYSREYKRKRFGCKPREHAQEATA